MQPHLNPGSATARQRQVVQRLAAEILVLHHVETLQKAHDHVRRLGERELLPDADAWATVELGLVSGRLLMGV